jgi:hypothetical protein
MMIMMILMMIMIMTTTMTMMLTKIFRSPPSAARGCVQDAAAGNAGQTAVRFFGSALCGVPWPAAVCGLDAWSWQVTPTRWRLGLLLLLLLSATFSVASTAAAGAHFVGCFLLWLLQVDSHLLAPLQLTRYIEVEPEQYDAVRQQLEAVAAFTRRSVVGARLEDGPGGVSEVETAAERQDAETLPMTRPWSPSTTGRARGETRRRTPLPLPVLSTGQVGTTQSGGDHEGEHAGGMGGSRAIDDRDDEGERPDGLLW